MGLFGRSIRRSGFRSIGWSRAYALDDHALNMDRRYRRVACVTRHLCNRFHDVHIFALSPDRVFPVERRIGGLSDKKVRIVCIRATIGHRQAPRRIELERRRDFALVWKAWPLG